MKRTFLPLVLVLLAGPAVAQDETYKEANYTAGTTEPGESRIESGNVVQMSLMVPGSSTDQWTGVYGNITSEYIVGKSRSPFFSWEFLEARYVYASRNGLDFQAEWRSRNKQDIRDSFPFLENSTESVDETFNTSHSLDSNFQNKTFDTVAARTFNSTGRPYWNTMYLSDGNAGFFAGEVDQGTSFNGEYADYQMILPEDGSESGGTEYGIYLELE